MDFAFSQTVDSQQLRNYFQTRFADSVAIVSDLTEFESANANIVLQLVDTNNVHFPQGLVLPCLELFSHNFGRTVHAIAHDLSLQLRCEICCDGTGVGDNASEYWLVLWKNGLPFLADGVDFEESTTAKPRLVRPLDPHFFAIAD